MLRWTSVFVFIIVTVHAMDFMYDTITTTLNGTQCLNNCVDHKCYIDYDLKEDSCNPGTVKAPLYHTAQFRTKRKFCLSGCGRFGNWEYDWCIIAADKKEWDYCSTAVSHEKTMVRGAHFTLEDHLCMDECKLDETNKYTCTVTWKEKLVCNPKKTKDYVQAQTSLGFDCVGLCSKAQNETYLWCYYGNDSTPKAKKWFVCAPPVSRRKTLFNANIYTYDLVGGDVPRF